MNLIQKYIQFMDALNEKTGLFCGWLTTLLVLNVFYDTVMRYAFNQGHIWLQEMEWHLFSVIFLIGAAYTLKYDGHVRVDILYTGFSAKTKAWIDLFGTFVFLIPFCIIVILSTQEFILNSWAVQETSPDPGGLPMRYVLKAMIPLGFTLLIGQGISEACKSVLIILGQREEGSA